MRRALLAHLRDFIALIGMVVIAVGIAGYILSNQRLRLPFLDEEPFRVYVELPNAQAVQPGQGQTVRVAGVKIGDIGKVELEDGIAVVELSLEPENEGLIREDATALLRTRTGLKDMFIEVDPGNGDPLPEDGRIPVSNTQQDVDSDEILSALDADTRDYLRLLISSGGKGLEGRGTDLRETFRRFAPLHRDLDRVSSAIARRRHNMRRLVNRYGRLTTELGDKDRELVRLVREANEVLGAFAERDREISSSVSQLPGTLRQTATTLGNVERLGDRLGPALESLRPAFRRLDGANRAVQPLFREATPILREQVRPFARAAQPFTRNLGAGAAGLAEANPDLATSFTELNRFFNIGAFNPGGAEGLTGNLAADRARQEGYLHWLGWLAQNTVSLFSTSDAQGPLRRIFLGGLNCANLPALGVPEAVGELLGTAGVCVRAGGGA